MTSRASKSLLFRQKIECVCVNSVHNDRWNMTRFGSSDCFISHYKQEVGNKQTASCAITPQSKIQFKKISNFDYRKIDPLLKSGQKSRTCRNFIYLFYYFSLIIFNNIFIDIL